MKDQILYKPAGVGVFCREDVNVTEEVVAQILTIGGTAEYKSKLLQSAQKPMIERVFKRWLKQKRAIVKELRLAVQTALKVELPDNLIKLVYRAEPDMKSRKLAEVTESDVTLYPY